MEDPAVYVVSNHTKHTQTTGKLTKPLHTECGEPQAFQHVMSTAGAKVHESLSLRMLPDQVLPTPALETQPPCKSCARFNSLYGHVWSTTDGLKVPSAAYKQRELVRKTEVKLSRKGAKRLGKAVGIDALMEETDKLEAMLKDLSGQTEKEKAPSTQSGRTAKPAGSKTRKRQGNAAGNDRVELQEPQLINVEETMELVQKALNVLYVR